MEVKKKKVVRPWCKSTYMTNFCVYREGHNGPHMTKFGMPWNRRPLRLLSKSR